MGEDERSRKWKEMGEDYKGEEIVNLVVSAHGGKCMCKLRRLYRKSRSSFCTNSTSGIFATK